MRLLMLLAICLFGRLSWAQEDANPYDLFGNPTDIIKVISADNNNTDEDNPVFLACDDKILQDRLMSIISSGDKIEKNESIINYRHRVLAQKHLTNFISLPLDSFNADENRKLAELLVSEKINKGMHDKDFAICVSDNPVLKHKVYLLQRYNSNNEILIDIIGYNADKILQFIYKK